MRGYTLALHGLFACIVLPSLYVFLSQLGHDNFIDNLFGCMGECEKKFCSTPGKPVQTAEAPTCTKQIRTVRCLGVPQQLALTCMFVCGSQRSAIIRESAAGHSCLEVLDSTNR